MPAVKQTDATPPIEEDVDAFRIAERNRMETNRLQELYLRLIEARCTSSVFQKPADILSDCDRMFVRVLEINAQEGGQGQGPR